MSWICLEVAHPKAVIPAVRTKARGHTGCRVRVFMGVGEERRGCPAGPAD